MTQNMHCDSISAAILNRGKLGKEFTKMEQKMTNDIAFLIIYILSLLLACCTVFDSNVLALKIVKMYFLPASSNFETYDLWLSLEA